jgi:hypothetical protein
MLWDSGTEMNQEPGTGDNQAPRQSGANVGPADTDSIVRLVNDGFTYPATADVISAMLEYIGANRFRVTLTNASTGSTLATSAGSVAVPLAPGGFVVHGATESPLFADGQADAGSGLEALAKDGDPSALAASLARDTGVPTIFAPGAWVVHADGNPIFVPGGPDAGLDGFTYPTGSQIIEVTLSLATSTGIETGSPELPSRVRLDQNYPNPFNPETRIQFEVADAGTARLTVFDLLGREVASLLDRTISAGSHSVTWNGKGAGGQQAPTGVYVYRLATAHGAVTKTMVLLQ